MRVSLTSNKRVRVRRESELTPKLRSCRTRAGSRRRERTVLPSWTMRGRKEQRPLPWRRRGLRRGASWYLCFSLLNFEAWPESRVRESSAEFEFCPGAQLLAIVLATTCSTWMNILRSAIDILPLLGRFNRSPQAIYNKPAGGDGGNNMAHFPNLL